MDKIIKKNIKGEDSRKNKWRKELLELVTGEKQADKEIDPEDPIVWFH